MHMVNTNKAQLSLSSISNPLNLLFKKKEDPLYFAFLNTLSIIARKLKPNAGQQKNDPDLPTPFQ